MSIFFEYPFRRNGFNLDDIQDGFAGISCLTKVMELRKH
jgi:hypothetical protein